MQAEIEILQPGLLSTIQDLGRFGYRKFGVPVSGAMDNYAAHLANVILQNSSDCAVIEITQMGPVIRFSGKAQIVITGADLSPVINGNKMKNNIIISLEAGDVLGFGRRISGCRSYLGIAGGFLSEKVLGSRSWYEGVTEVSKLKKGMRIPYKLPLAEVLQTFSAIKPQKEYLRATDIMVSPGPEFDRLTPGLQEQLFTQEFSMSKNNNRMALQLDGFPENEVRPIITGPVLPGTVQLTPGGNLIVLSRDCQTTGGYPRILQVTAQGMNTIAQKVLGEQVKFIRI